MANGIINPLRNALQGGTQGMNYWQNVLQNVQQNVQQPTAGPAMTPSFPGFENLGMNEPLPQGPPYYGFTKQEFTSMAAQGILPRSLPMGPTIPTPSTQPTTGQPPVKPPRPSPIPFGAQGGYGRQKSPLEEALRRLQGGM